MKRPNINQNYRPKQNKITKLELDKMRDGVHKGDRFYISSALTFVENKNYRFSSDKFHFLSSLNVTNDTLRIAITGSPGVGKSTFIDVIGQEFIKRGKNVAVLTIDPSSEKSRGSILGDKTRMASLSQSPKAYIRPSANNLESGGIRASTQQSILICEAAGFEIILVETVGVGQSEIEVSKVTDLTLLLLNPSGGDELQGIKKGIVEIADLILVNKADSHLDQAANKTLSDYRQAVHLRKSTTSILGGIEVKKVSALLNIGITEITAAILDASNTEQNKKIIHEKRDAQSEQWYTEQARLMVLDVIKEQKSIDRQIRELPKMNDYFGALVEWRKILSEKLKDW